MNESILSNRVWLVDFAVDYLVGVEPDVLDWLTEELAKRLGCPVRFYTEECAVHKCLYVSVGLWTGYGETELDQGYIKSMKSFFERDFWLVDVVYRIFSANTYSC